MPLAAVGSYAEDEVVYEVHTWEELDAAFRIANYDGTVDAFDLFYIDKFINNLMD